MAEIDTWFTENLVCPVDQTGLHAVRGQLVCEGDHRYPVVQGVPVMLVGDDRPTMPKAFKRSLDLAEAPDSLPEPEVGQGIDPWVQENITMICGKHFYGKLTGRLKAYPIPEIDLPPARGAEDLLDVGSNWGRWSIAAARLGYSVVGIDPMLEAVLSARRVAREHGVTARFVVGDARNLPFPNNRFGAVHSFGVFQHFSKENAQRAIAELGRVCAPGGVSLVQMTAAFGPLALWRRARYALANGPGRDPGGVEVRHWTPREIETVFGRLIGPTEVSVDAYFTILAHHGDLFHQLAWRHRMLLQASDALRSASRHVPAMAWGADSLFARSRKPGSAATHPVEASTA